MQSDDLTMPKYVGIDISKNHLSKNHLDWALRSDEEGLLQTGRVANTPEQREQLSNRLAKAGPDRVVCEATGGLEHPLAAALVAEELPVAVVNPERTRDFAGALGRKDGPQREV
jgi:transposase